MDANHSRLCVEAISGISIYLGGPPTSTHARLASLVARIQDTPTLWTDIVLYERIDDITRKVALGLHYSKAAPLSLFLFSPGTWSAVRSMAPSMQFRIFSLHFISILPEKEVEFIINDLFPLPSLTRMSAPWFRYIDKAFFHRHPSITDLKGAGVPIVDLCACLPRLTKLQWNATEDISTTFRLLGGISHLKEVAIEYVGPGEEIEEFPPDFGSPAWTHLTYRRHTLRLYEGYTLYLSLYVTISSLVNDLSLTLPEFDRLESLEILVLESEADEPLNAPHNQKPTTPTRP